MSSLRRIRPWIACLAILLNILAMPLSRAMQAPDVNLMLWGGFCSGGNSSVVSAEFRQAIEALQIPQSEPEPEHAMHHADCCCGHAGLAALPSDYYRHFLPQYTPGVVLEDPELPTLHPRIRWPSLSPRASPFA
jgi:hypothetical protein